MTGKRCYSISEGLMHIGKARLLLLGAAVIALATVVAYLPAMRGGFVWDDNDYVTENPLLTAPDGLTRIWFSLDSPSQYFPLVYTMFRIEHAMWGLDPTGYHVVNAILHIANALLVWLVLSRLRIPGAWLAAAIWALHPVNVESVAWITERKNTLSTVFYLTSLLAWMRFADDKQEKPWRFYALSLVLYQLALFAKTTACTLPAALLLVLWLRGQRVEWRRLVQVAPYVVLGLAMGLISVWWEQHHQGTRGPEFAFTPVERILIASRALWFYIGKLVFPSKLAFSYPKWDIDPASPAQYVWPIACVVVGVLLWWKRNLVGRGPIAALVFFVTALTPMLGFVSLYTFRYTYVADHYQYIASIGVIALFSALLGRAWRRVERAQAGRRIVPAIILVALSMLTWRQGHIYKDLETLWKDTLAKNPQSWMAHVGLGVVLQGRGEGQAAIRHYRAALHINPENSEGHMNLGVELMRVRRYDDAQAHLRRALKLCPQDPKVHFNLATALMECGKASDSIPYYSQSIRLDPYDPEAHSNLGNALAALGRNDEAIASFRMALQLDPGHALANTNLANILVIQGHCDEAVKHYRQALETNPCMPEAHLGLACALAAQGDSEEAAREYDEAIRLNPELASSVLPKSDPAGTHFNRALSLEQAGKVKEAISEYRLAIRINPSLAEAHNNLGVLLKDQGRIDEAIREYREALRLRPDFAEAHNNLAVALYSRGDYAGAWREVHLCRKCGVEPPQGFVQALSAQMSDPGG